MLKQSDGKSLEKCVKEYQTASAACPWKGRRGPEAATGSIDKIIADVRDAGKHHQELQQWYAAADPGAKSVVRQFEVDISSSLLERMREKLQFWQCLPYSLLGVWQLRDTVKSKAMARAAIAEYAVAVGKAVAHKIHRVAQRFLAPDGEFTEDFADYAHSCMPLSEFPQLFIELRAYAWSPLVSRRVEGLHARVRSFFMKGPNALVPSLSCRLRRGQLQKLLSQRGPFDFFAKQWPIRGYMDRALRPVFKVGEVWQLRVHPVSWKVAVFYQCVKDTQFRQRDEESSLASKWSKITKPFRAPAQVELSDAQKMMVSFLRDKFSVPGVIWSMPSALLQPVEFVAMTVRGGWGNMT